jgi:hypothetical protein
VWHLNPEYARSIAVVTIWWICILSIPEVGLMSTSTPQGAAVPFAAPSQLLPLRGLYPPLGNLLGLSDPQARAAREGFVKLWLTEGIPFAFQECPAVYEEIRGWLAMRLGVHSKDVTLVGSARLGFSLSPGPLLGRAFGPHSDLDLAVVSSDLFACFRTLFEEWARDYEEGVVRPRNDKEHTFWEENLAFGRRNIPKGFFDPNKIPTFDRYPLAQRVGHTLWVVVKKLEATTNAPRPRRASLRIYNGWRSLVDRVSLNLRCGLSQ